MQKSHINNLSEFLAKHNYKVTEARKAVFAVLYEAELPISPSELVEACVKIAPSSAYRCLDLFVKLGVARYVPKGFKAYYELGDHFAAHCHYVTCEICGKSVAVSNEKIERAMEELTRMAGMQATKHHVELLGICDDCLAKKNAAQGRAAKVRKVR